MKSLTNFRCHKICFCNEQPDFNTAETTLSIQINKINFKINLLLCIIWSAQIIKNIKQYKLLYTPQIIKILRSI